MGQVSDIGADADAEMTVLCGMSVVFFVGSDNSILLTLESGLRLL